MAASSRGSDVKHIWIQPGKIDRIHFVGKDVLAIGSGCYIQFHDLLTHKELYYGAINKDLGDGIQCIAGHRNALLFAFAEKCIDPRILVLSYPDFSHLSVMKENDTHGYLDIFFAEMEYLVSFNLYPNNRVTLWNWRRSEKLTSHETEILGTDVFTKFSMNVPISFSQMARNSKHISMWEVHACYKNNYFIKNEIKLPGDFSYPCCFAWTPEHVLLAVDQSGNIYTVSSDTLHVRLTLPYKGEGGNSDPRIAWFRGGIVVSGPDSCIRYFKYSAGNWEDPLLVELEHSVIQLNANRETAVAIASKVELLLLHLDETLVIQKIKSFKHNFCSMAIINSAEDVLATLDTGGVVELWDLKSGQTLCEFPANQEYLTMASSPRLPFLALGCESGAIDFLNVYDFSEPSILTQVFLSQNPIQLIKFTVNNDILIAVSKESGEFFFIQALIGDKIDVLYYEKIEMKIVDVTCLEKTTDLTIIILVGTPEYCDRGDQIMVYKKTSISQTFESSISLQLLGKYTTICSTPRSNKQFFGIPQYSRQVHRIDIKAQCMVAKAWLSDHQVGEIAAVSNNKYLITFGLDGLVFLYDNSDEATKLVLHHRNDGGVKMVATDPSGNYVVSLGNDGSLICIYLRVGTDKKNERRESDVASKSESIKTMFTVKKTTGITEKSWLEIQRHNKLKEEEKENQFERTKIKKELEGIKSKLKQLLDKNDENPPEEQLPVHVFDLDYNFRAEKLKKAAADRLKRQNYLLLKCKLQDELGTKLKEQFWNSMEIKGKALKALTQSLSIDSFPIPFKDLNFEKQFQEVMFLRKIENELNLEKFEPWEHRTRQSVEIRSESRVSAQISATDNIRELLLGDPVSETEKPQDFDDPAMLDGSISHKFIEPLTNLYSQFEISTFNQMHNQSLMLIQVMDILRKFFNKKFDDMVQFKKTQIDFIIKENSRLRYILSELKNTTTIITDPEWYPEENPDTIMKVEPEEVFIAPYISPSQQAILDKIAAEEEARRLAELADNFRELALIEMMDGVLEVRWEDIIKRDIPIPKCMIEKKPEEYNEDDIKIIKEYNEKVEFLMSERERYRKMLEQEFAKLTVTIQETTENLDSHLSELYKLKLQVQSAIDQELFKILRYRYISFQRQKLMEKEQIELWKIEKNDILAKKFMNIISSLQTAANDCRALYENLATKDKLLEKNFKKEFSGVQAIVLEQLYKAFRRRPKQLQKILASKLVITNLMLILTSRKVFILAESRDFLGALDAMDNYSNVTGTISEELWSVLCRMRRVKIESELKVKACALDMADIDSTIHHFQKRVTKLEKHKVFLQSELDAVREEMLKIVHNTQIQLVMKQGLVEIVVTGKIEDFKDAVLISRNHVESINGKIKKAGDVKLRAMQDTAKFRRVILQTEWNHRRMMLRIEDLKDHLYTLESMKVTRDVQLYFRQKEEGRGVDRGLVIEREIQIIRETFERAVRYIENQIQEVELKFQQKTKENKVMNKQIVDLNVDVNEQQLQRDLEFEAATEESTRKRMMYILKRGKLARKIQEQHNRLMLLETELELLRLKTYPTLKYKTLF